MRSKTKQKLKSVVEEIVFGVEDSLVSTLGAVTGVAAGTGSSYVVILTGVVLIFAEALSMTAGSYLSSKSEAEVWLDEHAGDWERLMKAGAGRGPIAAAMDKQNLSKEARAAVLAAVEVQRKRWLGQVIRHEKNASPAGNKLPTVAAAVMGASYLMAGIIPLGAYLVLPIQLATWVSVVVTGIALFLFGLWKATLTNRSGLKSGAEMVLIAMAAAGIAWLLGFGVRMIFGIAV